MSAVDLYCRKCGAGQPVQPGFAGPAVDPFASVTPRTASILCYVPGIGWMVSIVVLAVDRFRNDRAVRFHAFQGLYLFVAWLMAGMVLRPMSDALTMPRIQFDPDFFVASHFHFDRIVEAILLGMSIFMMVKAARDEAFSLPLFGELAQRSLNQN